MAIIQMWPQNQGLRNSISFAGRAYSSIPGVSIPVPDFDVAVLQANGWTTYATIAGKNTITMLPSVSELMAIPVDTVVPTITGTAQVGQTLTASTGTWTNSPTSYAYQWNSSAGGAIPGATASTYVPVTGDIGNTLTVSVVATNSGGSSSPATSAATNAVAAAGSVPANTVLPTISGTPQVGQTLTATNGTWTNSPTSFTYQWNRAGTPIGGATAATYVPVSADVGNSLTISVTGTNGSGSSAPATSSATSSVIDIIPTNLAVPTISGTARVGQTGAVAEVVGN